MPSSPIVGSCLALLLAACGGSSSPAAVTLTGNLNGQPMPALHAFAAVQTTSNAGLNGYASVPELGVVFTSDASFSCDQVFSQPPKSARTVRMGLTRLANKAWAVPDGLGTFAADVQDTSAGGSEGNHVLVEYGESDASCNVIKSGRALAVNGAVTLSKLSTLPGNAVEGSFFFFFDSGDQITGQFSTTICPTSPAAAGLCR